MIVLVTLLFATFALTAFLDRASGDLIVATREADSEHLRKEAYSALETTLAVLSAYSQANNGVLRSPAEGWGEPLEFAEWTPSEGRAVEVSFIDESGKIPLPTVQANVLLAAFKAWEIDDGPAQEATDALMMWMTTGYTPASAISPTYDQAPLPYAAPARSLRSYHELASIDHVRELLYSEDGRPNAHWHRFVATFSLLNYTRPNLNSATDDVLLILGMWDTTQIAALREYLTATGASEGNQPGYFVSTTAAGPIVGGQANLTVFNTQISALRVIVRVREGNSDAGFRLSAVVTPAAGGAQTVAAAATAGGAAASGGRAGRGAQPAGQAAGGQARGGAPAGAAATPGANPANPAAGAAAAPTLNYPFTVLEIREENEVPPPLPTPSDEE